MAKDDYHVIVYQILSYLYGQLKKGLPVDPDCLRYDGKLYTIPEAYWQYIIANLLSSGYICGVTATSKVNYYGERVVNIQNLEMTQITPAGIEYLTENSFMKKAIRFVKDVTSIVPFRSCDYT